MISNKESEFETQSHNVTCQHQQCWQNMLKYLNHLSSYSIQLQNHNLLSSCLPQHYLRTDFSSNHVHIHGIVQRSIPEYGRIHVCFMKVIRANIDIIMTMLTCLYTHAKFSGKIPNGLTYTHRKSNEPRAQ